MNYQRVQQILNSPENIEVLYNGKPIWIQDLQANGVTANVSFNASPFHNTVPVPIHELKEGGKEAEGDLRTNIIT